VGLDGRIERGNAVGISSGVDGTAGRRDAQAAAAVWWAGWIDQEAVEELISGLEEGSEVADLFKRLHSSGSDL